jgi:peptide/nickel transport system substrate-binding protein
MKIAKKMAMTAAAAVAAVGLLAGCAAGPAGGDGGDNAFVVAVGTNPAHLNPAITTDNSTGFVGQAVYEPLVLLSNDFELVPALAKSWESNDDATQFTFHLQEGVTWHDGEPFTSEDVKFFFEEVMELHPLGGPIIAVMESVDTPDESTVVLNLSEPFGPVVEAMTSFPILPAHIFAGTDILTNEANMAPVGTGPFVLEKFNTGDSVELKKNEDYWGEQGDVDSLIFKVMPDNSARTLALQSGDVDFIPETFFELAQRSVLEGDDRYYIFEAGTQPQQMLMFYNTKNPVLADYDVRQALLRAIDREAVSSKVYLGTATPAIAPIPNQVAWAIDPSIDFTKQFAYDQAEAEKLLDAAGYPKGADGKRFTVSLNYITGLPTFAGTAELIKSNLEQIGVEVNLVAEDVNVYVESTFTNSTFDLSVIELAGYADPNLGSSRVYVCNAGKTAFANASQICDDVIDTAFIKASQTSDRDERMGYFTEAQNRIAETLGAAPIASAFSIGAGRADKWDGLDEFTGYNFRYWSALEAK